jgi:hypothetical protein
MIDASLCFVNKKQTYIPPSATHEEGQACEAQAHESAEVF